MTKARMSPSARGHGAALLLALVAVVMLAALALHASTRALTRDRDLLGERALAHAREALLAYASDHPINAAVGPGYLPCPDLDNDGWAQSTCGSLAGDTGQEQRLGRLPWKTLGLPDLRDGHGERLWYAVSTRYKGLLNCAASRACVDMSPAAALGTITVRDSTGVVLHDGTIAAASRASEGGAVAVVFAPGPPLARGDAMQRRDCSLAECDTAGRCVVEPPQRAALCDPANYLDGDNAAFVDRSDPAGRALNVDGFVQGPVSRDGRVVVNDRLAVITYGEIMPRVMRRVALEVASCLRFYASRPENAGRLPSMAAACADPAGPLAEVAGNAEGRVPDTPFLASAAQGRLERWWRAHARSPEALPELPTRDDACRIAVPPDDAGPMRTAAPGTPANEAGTAGASAPSWWNTWKAYVSVAIVRRDAGVLADPHSALVAVRASSGACSTPLVSCDAAGCRATPAAGDAVAWLP